MIVCLEGINGSGKTTLAAELARNWTGGSARVIDPVRHTSFGRILRTAIMDAAAPNAGHDSGVPLPADAETLAFAAARLHGGTALTSPAIAADELVVLERWAGAVIAYGAASAANPFLLRALEAVLAAALPIDHTLLLDVPGQTADDRLRTESEVNRFETAGAAYLEKVRRQYLAWATLRGIPVINAATDPRSVAMHAISLLELTMNGITKETA